MTDARVMLNGYQYARSYMTNNWIYRLSYKVAKIKHSEVVWEPRPVYVCVCVYGPPVLGFGVLMACPSVCMYMDQQFWVLAVFTVLMGLSICVCVCTWTISFGFWQFSQF